MSIEELPENVVFYLEKTFSQNPSDLAHLLRYLYYDIVRFDCKNWYYFKQYRWICLDEHDNPLGHLLRNDLVNKYLILSSRYNLEATRKSQRQSEGESSTSSNSRSNRGSSGVISEGGRDGIRRDGSLMRRDGREEDEVYLPLVISHLTYQSKICLEISLRISDHSYFQKIMVIAQELFTDKNFTQTLDKKTNLIGFSNGVYNLSERKFHFPASYDRVFMEVDYPYNMEGKFEKEVREWFSGMKLDGLLPLLGATLSGEVRGPPIWITGLSDEMFRDLYGLLKWTFGDYLGEMPFSALRKRKISKSETHSWLVGNCKKRLVVVEQAEDDHPSVNPRMVDFLLTQESLNLRLPYEMGHEYLPQFSLLILSKHKAPEPGEGFQVFQLGKTHQETEEVDGESSSSGSDSVSSVQEKWKYDLMKILLDFYQK